MRLHWYRSDTEGIVRSQHYFITVFDQILANGFGGYIEFRRDRVCGEQLNIIIVGDGLVELLKDEFFECIYRLGDLNLKSYLGSASY
jgi:hypothetical protein